MDDEKRVLICMLVEDYEDEPPAHSYVDHCGKCKAAVWHAYTSPQVDVVWCHHCAREEIAAEKKAGGKPVLEQPTKEQMAEFKRYWN